MKLATGCALAVLLVAAAAWGDEPQVVGWRNSVIITASLPGSTPADRAVRQKLDDTVVTFTFNDQPFEEAMNFLATLGGVNIVIDKAKVEAGKTVTLRLSDVPLLTAVKLTVEQAGLKWAVRDGVIVISNEEGVKSEPVTVVYDVTDMLNPPPDFEGPEFDLANLSGNKSGGTGGTGSPGGIDSIWKTDTQKKETQKTHDELLNEIVELVKQMVASGTWDTE